MPAATAGAVTGGGPATREYPHMAAVYAQRSTSPDAPHVFHCGGSLVDATRVLTAAHCVLRDADRDGKMEPVPARAIEIVLGTSDLSQPDSGERLRVRAIEPHPGYEHATTRFDVALVTVERRARRGSPIAIARPSQRAAWRPGAAATLIGWGTQFARDPRGTRDRLGEVRVPIVADDDCGRSYSHPYGGFNPVTMVCAGEIYGTKDACQHDSGGPLMVDDGAGRSLVVGTVSWGFECGLPTQYGVYARVADDPLRGWIAARLRHAP